MKRGSLFAAAPTIGVVGLLLLWQVLVRMFDVTELPGPWQVLGHLATDPRYYWINARRTAWTASIGFAIALFGGLCAGAVMAQSRFVERAVQPLAVLLQVTPIVAYAPAVVIWLGFGLEPILVLTSLVCVVPFMLNTVTGLRAADPSVIELARSVDASRFEVLWWIQFPSALPYLFTAARISVGLALIGSVLGEFFTLARTGLGYSVLQGIKFGLPLQLWGSVFVLALMGSIATAAISMLERACLRCQPSAER